MANNELQVKIVLRSDSAANWSTSNPVLLKGEVGYEYDTGKLKFGDGVTAWSGLTYFGGNVDLSGLMRKVDYEGSAVGVVKAADKLQTPRNINGVAFDGTQDITIQDNTKIPTSEKGAPNGVATLDQSGLIPAAQLPSFVDDVIEGYYNAAQNAFYKEPSYTNQIPAESGKIYVDLSEGASYTQYRWSGTTYVSITDSLDIATTEEATAGTNDTKVMTPLKTAQAINARGYITETAANAAFEPKIAVKGTAFNVNFGTTAGTAVEGNDSRLSDPRTPTGTAGGDLAGTYPNPTIKAAAITDEKIAASALSTSKLFVPSGDTLILNGGSGQA